MQMSTYLSFRDEINNNFDQIITLSALFEHETINFFPSFVNNEGKKSRGLETKFKFKLSDIVTAKLIWS